VFKAHNLKVTGSNPVPATTFVITRSPSQFNRRDGLSFSGNSGGRGDSAGPDKFCAYQVHLAWPTATADDEHYVYTMAL
jgi:hypothetical protein